MSDNNLNAMRHSLAHITAAAVLRLWPEAKFGVGPVIKDGFYYDIDIPNVTISTDDFDKIETEMQKIIAEKQTFKHSEKQIDSAIVWAEEAKQPYKQELLNDLKRSGTTVAKDLNADEFGTIAPSPSAKTGGDVVIENVSFYTNGDFTDLCRGPHIENTTAVGAFRLIRIAGAYWRGKETNPQMQRLYGVAFDTKQELAHYLDLQKQAKQRDHRKIGQELDLFTFSPLVGAGLPLFTPRGTILREQLTSFSESLRTETGFERVHIPHITKTELYKVSGHWDKFGDELFLVKSQETKDEFALKPMNCPHHNQIYAAKPRSYRDLPVRYFETTTVYRDEKTGELGGLSRVRSITQDDSHIYARRDHLETEVTMLIDAVQKLYLALDLPLKARLSFRDDGDSYLGEKDLWNEAQDIIAKIAQANKLDYFVAEGEAAFYGPKIDFMAIDALEREHQIATVQLDFVQPERFKLEYTADDGSKQQPVMIHSALLGSIERFLSIYIEHTAGKFPVWLAPEQLRIIQVKDDEKLSDFVDKITAIAKEKDVRVAIDRSNESVGKKIRTAEILKVPYSVVIGEKELETGKLIPRVRKDLAVEDRDEISLPFENLISSIANEARSRVQKSSI